MMSSELGKRFAMAGMLLAAALLGGPAAAKQGADLEQFEIRTLSNRADLISGGDALVEVTVPAKLQLKHVTLLLNGRDVTATFRADATGKVLRGLLTGLALGNNEFVADSNGQGRGRPRASL